MKINRTITNNVRFLKKKFHKVKLKLRVSDRPPPIGTPAAARGAIWLKIMRKKVIFLHGNGAGGVRVHDIDILIPPTQLDNEQVGDY